MDETKEKPESHEGAIHHNLEKEPGSGSSTDKKLGETTSSTGTRRKTRDEQHKGRSELSDVFPHTMEKKPSFGSSTDKKHSKTTSFTGARRKTRDEQYKVLNPSELGFRHPERQSALTWPGLREREEVAPPLPGEKEKTVLESADKEMQEWNRRHLEIKRQLANAWFNFVSSYFTNSLQWMDIGVGEARHSTSDLLCDYSVDPSSYTKSSQSTDIGVGEARHSTSDLLSVLNHETANSRPGVPNPIRLS